MMEKTPWIDTLIAKLEGLEDTAAAAAVGVEVANLIAFLRNNRDLLVGWGWDALIDVAQIYQDAGEDVAIDALIEQLDPDALNLRLQRNSERFKALAVKAEERLGFIEQIPKYVPWTLLFLLLARGGGK